MNPATICAGFRKCGVYPFKPDAIDCGTGVTNPNSSDKDQQSEKAVKIASGENTGNHDKMQQSRITSEKNSDRQWSAEKLHFSSGDVKRATTCLMKSTYSGYMRPTQMQKIPVAMIMYL